MELLPCSLTDICLCYVVQIVIICGIEYGFFGRSVFWCWPWVMVVSFVKTEFFQKEGTTWILCIFRLQSCIIEWSCSLACGQNVLQIVIKWSGTYYRMLLVTFTWNNSIWCWRNLFGSCDNNFVIQIGTLIKKNWMSSPCRCCSDIRESITMFSGSQAWSTCRSDES